MYEINEVGYAIHYKERKGDWTFSGGEKQGADASGYSSGVGMRSAFLDLEIKTSLCFFQKM